MTTNIDFIVLNTKDPSIIGIADKSVWGVAEALPAHLIVTPPGSTRSISLVFAKEKITFLNSTNLGLTCVTDGCEGQEYEALQDGVWEFCLQSGYTGIEKKRFYLKDDSLRMELGKMYIKQNLKYDPDSEIFKQTQRVRFYLDSAQAFIKDGDIVWAKRAFDQANKLFNKQQ